MITELRISAIANLVVGDAILLAALVQVKRPGQAATLFCLIAAIMGVVWATVGPSGRLRRQTPKAPEPPRDASYETAGMTVRRTLVGLIPVAIALGILVAVAPETAALLAGISSGLGAGDLWTLGWARSFEAKNLDTIEREAPPNPFSGSPRSVYTRPMKALTEET